jgi:anthranilate synthase/aminodeoxychorismate synthase-like glutamine amidotransferase
VAQAGRIMHGKSSAIHHKGVGVFAGLPDPFSAIRYHSLAIMREGFPDCLEVTAWADDGEIMGVRHRRFDVQGVQFHPESFMTEHGKEILKNFLKERRT